MRLDGWESRLNSIVESARSAPYALGQHDCFHMACDVVMALSGRDLWSRYGGYTSRREAMETLASQGSSFEEAFDVLGERIVVKRARRGDICCVQSDDGQKHLGVCLGMATAMLSEKGLEFIATAGCLCAWKID